MTALRHDDSPSDTVKLKYMLRIDAIQPELQIA